MVGYVASVKKDIARWHDADLIDAPTAEALTRDIEQHVRSRVSFGTVLATLAALLFGAAILLLVAANWDAFPRIGRVGALFAVILGGYVGGAVLKTRGHPALGEAVWLIAAAAFGGGIALIGQMYHLSGDEEDAVVVWGAGVALAALMLRSGVLTVAAVALADYWLAMRGFDFWSHRDFPTLYLAFWAALWALSYWTMANAARHLLLISLGAFFCLATITFHEHGLAIGGAMALGYAALFGFAAFVPDLAERLFLVNGRLALHALLGFLTGITIVQFLLIDETGALLLSAIVVLAAVSTAILSAGRDSRAIRWLAYVGFGFEICFIYAVTLGTMLGAAGFFLAAGLILAGMAIIITRLERRMRSGALATGRAA